MRLTRALPLLWALTGLACEHALGPRSDGVLEATADGAQLRLRNVSTRPVHFTVFARDPGGGMPLFMLCVGPGCPALDPGAVEVVRYTDVGGYRPGTRAAVVYWWHAVRGVDSAWVADSIRELVVPLRP